MIAFIYSSGAICCDVSENKVDKMMKENKLSTSPCQRKLKPKAWVFHGKDLPKQLIKLGVTQCYVDIESDEIQIKTDAFLKVSVEKLMAIWEKIFN